MNSARLCLATVMIWLTALSGICPAGDRPTVAQELGRLDTIDLATAQRLALIANPDLAAAAARVAQAAQRVRQAQAAYWPTLDATAGANRVTLSETTEQSRLATARLIDPAATIDNPEDQYSVGLRAAWVLFDGFERRFSNAEARFGNARSEMARQDAQRILLNAVAQSFHQAQLARERVAILKADEQFNRRQTADAQARFKMGTGALSDVLNFKVLVNSAISERIKAENDYRAARIGLAALIGLEQARLPETLDLAGLEKDMTIPSMPDVAALVTYAVDHRPDLKAQRHALEAAGAGVGRAKAPFYPVIEVAATLDGGRNADIGFEGDDFGNSVGVVLRYNLFNGNASRARLAEARHFQDETEQRLAALQLSVAEDVRAAVSNVRAAGRLLELQRENAALVRQNRDLVKKEYEAGQASLVRLNEAQRNLTQAQGQLALARAGLAQAQAGLDAATAKNLVPFGHPAER